MVCSCLQHAQKEDILFSKVWAVHQLYFSTFNLCHETKRLSATDCWEFQQIKARAIFCKNDVATCLEGGVGQCFAYLNAFKTEMVMTYILQLPLPADA